MSKKLKGSFATRLKESRKIRGLSQTALAKKAAVPPSAISHFESGERKPSFETLRRLAETLDVTIDFLLGRINEDDDLADADPLYRGVQKMNHADRELIRDFIEMLKKRGGDNSSNEEK